MQPDAERLISEIRAAPLVRPIGRVAAVHSGIVLVQGISDSARIGSQTVMRRQHGRALTGEIVRIDQEYAHVLPGFPPDGVSVGDPVVLRDVPRLAPCLSWIGRVVDPFGCPLDGRPLRNGAEARDLTAAPPPAAQRKPMGDRITTGLAVMNTILPIVRGQRVGLFAGSGVGKSQLLARLASGVETDVVVIALIGERGREVREFIDKTMGSEGMKRAIVVAATSDQSALTRRRCAWTAMTIAEFLRDAGKQVLFLADSVTRFAEAHREIAAVSGEAPSLRGFPPSITPMITGLCERAGPGTEDQGDITAVFSVLVAGSDMDEPVADILRGVLDGHVILNRDIAERGRYPAIDVLKSVSRSLPDAATPAENMMIRDVRKLLGIYEKSEVMIKAGLYVEGSDPLLDQAVRLWPELDEYLARSDAESPSANFDRLALLLRRAAAISR